MSNLNLYNTLTRSIKRVIRRGKHFTVYFCGPTVYNYAHIGNFRTYLLEDVFVRMLKFEGYNPFVVRNITDVDDKTIRDSRKAGLKLSDFTEKYTKIFHDDCKKLNILLPDIEPRAASHIGEQLELISALVEKGYAYVSEGSVYFRVSSFKNYGRLSNIGNRELQTQTLDSAGKKNTADEYDRESVADFVLWKARKLEDGENYWESPWGEGRPGWHIECSAMSMKYLGKTIDLHGGGVDLCFPHHENEIAQSEAYSDEKFVHHWMHIAHLMVDGAKMSKSLGNLYTLQDIESYGFPPEALRYCLIAGHYRQPLNFTMNGLHAADTALKKLCKFSEKLQFSRKVENFPDWYFFGDAYAALLEDLNTPLCLGNIFKAIAAIDFDSLSDERRAILAMEFSAIKYVLGLEFNGGSEVSVPEDIRALAEARWEAKLSENYVFADRIRQEIEAAGWVVNDSKSGFTVEKK